MEFKSFLLVWFIHSCIQGLHFNQTSSIEENQQLIFIQQVNRHGAIYPTQKSNITPLQNRIRDTDWGQLTNQGRRMSYQLGKIMYKLYWERLFGINNISFFDVKDQFFVRSSDSNRTFESAESFCFGLFQDLLIDQLTPNEVNFIQPPHKLAKKHNETGPLYGRKGAYNHYIPIHQVNKTMTSQSNGDFLVRYLQQSCPFVDEWHNSNLKLSQYEPIYNDNKTNELISHFNKATGLNISMNSQFILVFSQFISLAYIGFKLPPIFNLSSQRYKQLSILYNIGQMILQFGNKQQLLANSIDLVRQLINNMKNVINKTNNKKWIIYYAHHVPISSVFVLMNFTSIQCSFKALKKENITNEIDCLPQGVPYGSSLVFQLYNKTQQNSIVFKVNFNGRHLRIPFCQYQTQCSVQTLQTWFKPYDKYDVKDLCGFNRTKTNN